MERNPQESQAPELYVGPGADELDDLDAPEPPTWPKAIGIISIVWGAIGLVCGGVGVASPFIMSGFVGNMPGGAPPALTTPNPALIGVQAVSLVWTVVLIVAGALTLARKPAGRTTHLIWVVGALVLAGVITYLNMQQQAAIQEWIRQNPDAAFSKQSDTGGGMGTIFGWVCGLTLGFAWPLFILIWFGLVKRKPSDITQGVTELVA